MVRARPGPRGGSALADLHIAGSLKALFPRPSDDALQVVLLNTAGGVTGGDTFDTDITAEAGARVTATTQAAERIYRAAPGSIGRVQTRLTVAPGASLSWLPQETILFDGAALDRDLRIEALGDARVLLCETLVFGRTAMGEVVRQLHLRDRIDVYVEGELVFADRLRLMGDAQALLDRPGVTAGGLAVASVVLLAPGAAARAKALRAQLPQTCGVSAISDSLLFLRLIAQDSFVLRQVLMPVLADLSATQLPRPWMI